MKVTGFNDYSMRTHDFGSLSGNIDYVEDLISQGTSFNILYSERGSLIVERQKLKAYLLKKL